MIEVQSLTKSLTSGIQKIEILKGINLTVENGEVIAIEGPSGSGKSTLLGLLAGFDSPTSGSIKSTERRSLRLTRTIWRFCAGKSWGSCFNPTISFPP